MDMQATVRRLSGNYLLDSFESDCQDFLAKRMLTKPIMSGEVLYELDAPLLNLIFPHEGLISYQYTLKDGRTVERMAVGTDGFVGMQYLIGETRLSSQVVTVIAGRASWVTVQDFDAALKKFPGIRPLVRAFFVNEMRGVLQTAVCAGVHTASQRIATWLLRADDRSQTSRFDITQRTLANIFGLRLATVSDACSRLHNAGAIAHSRGSINIVDRPLLEAQACECYEAVRQRQRG